MRCDAIQCECGAARACRVGYVVEPLPKTDAVTSIESLLFFVCVCVRFFDQSIRPRSCHLFCKIKCTRLCLESGQLSRPP